LTHVEKHAERFGSISRQIWEAPELGFEESKSSALLQQELEANGFAIQRGVAGMPTAFTASWGTGKPVIVLMGEFDALPGLSQKELATKAPVREGAPGHGCGHNLLGAGSALAAVALKEEMNARGLKGTIRYYGTPAEEGGGGKIYMLHAGLFRDVDVALYWHPNDTNTVNLRPYLANNGGKFRFYGLASHTMLADRGRSALDAVLIMANAIELLREHIPNETRIQYVISNGGNVPNIVPDFAEIDLVARGPDALILRSVWDRILKCAQAGALASETRFEFEQGINYANLLPNDELADVLSRALQKAGGFHYTPDEREFAENLQKTLGVAIKPPGPENVFTNKSEDLFPASGDVGDVSWVVPTAQVMAATYVPGVTSHTWQATACVGSSIGRKGMLVAARTLALAGMELVENPAKVQAARMAFEKRKAGRMWTTHITPDSRPRLRKH
jgi:aminobenzoyl-glutamate utilization protein B